jgi:hypothetical protein
MALIKRFSVFGLESLQNFDMRTLGAYQALRKGRRQQTCPQHLQVVIILIDCCFDNRYSDPRTYLFNFVYVPFLQEPLHGVLESDSISKFPVLRF